MQLVLPRLYVILDASVVYPGHRGEIDAARMLVESGVRLVQYRNKAAPSREQLRLSSQLAEFFLPRGTAFFVNDRPDIAVLSGADGVHVGQDDLSVEETRRIAGPEIRIGVSTHTLDQVGRAAETSADYIAVGPVFETRTKASPGPVVGLDLLRRARALTTKPLVAIGGITLERAAEILSAGADSLAVVSDIWAAPDPRERIRQYQKLFAASAAA